MSANVPGSTWRSHCASRKDSGLGVIGCHMVLDTQLPDATPIGGDETGVVDQRRVARRAMQPQPRHRAHTVDMVASFLDMRLSTWQRYTEVVGADLQINLATDYLQIRRSPQMN